MKRTVNQSTFLLIFTLLGLFFLSTTIVQKIRGLTISALTSSFEQLAIAKTKVHTLTAGFSFGKSQEGLNQEEEIKRLKLENQLLNEEVVRLKEFLEQELNLLGQGFNEQLFGTSNSAIKQIFSNHQNHILNLYQLQLASLPARVIFRSANSWNSSLWINLGEQDNADLPTPIIAKNSPVVLGDSVVGIIDFVGKKQSRVRLITDTALNLSVRIFRDGIFLAKGEITGQSLPLWRSREQVLLGSGFNYDFADEEGPSRDLRTGDPAYEKGERIPLLQKDDLLVTTGMDGVFPPGLRVGIISHIDPLKEGDYYYNLKAKPTAGNLQDITLVFVLPPLGYNFEEKPPILP